MLFNLYVRDSSQGIENSTSRSHKRTFLWAADRAASLFEYVYLPRLCLYVSCALVCCACALLPVRNDWTRCLRSTWAPTWRSSTGGLCTTTTAARWSRCCRRWPWCSSPGRPCRCSSSARRRSAWCGTWFRRTGPSQCLRTGKSLCTHRRGCFKGKADYCFACIEVGTRLWSKTLP